MLTKQNKIDLVKDITDRIKKSASVLLVDFTGLKVAEISNLRNTLRKQEIGTKVVKKTLIQRAMNESGIVGFDVSQFPSSIALIFSPEDGLIVSKEAYDFSKKQKNLKILGGILNSNFTPADEVIVLAKLPSREGLLGQLAGMLNNIPGSFVIALDQIAKSRV